jgi:hypothetical protein
MKPEEVLSPNLRPILAQEVELGNVVIEVLEPPDCKCPLLVVLERPVHSWEVDHNLSLAPAVQWWESRDLHYPVQGGYECKETGHFLVGPLAGDPHSGTTSRRLQEETVSPTSPLRTFSRNLRPILELEIGLSNVPARIDMPRDAECPRAVVLVAPLHFREIERRLSLSPAVERWESSDPDHPREAGFVCRETGHVLAGPKER